MEERRQLHSYSVGGSAAGESPTDAVSSRVSVVYLSRTLKPCTACRVQSDPRTSLWMKWRRFMNQASSMGSMEWVPLVNLVDKLAHIDVIFLIHNSLYRTHHCIHWPIGNERFRTRHAGIDGRPSAVDQSNVEYRVTDQKPVLDHWRYLIHCYFTKTNCNTIQSYKKIRVNKNYSYWNYLYGFNNTFSSYNIWPNIFLGVVLSCVLCCVSICMSRCASPAHGEAGRLPQPAAAVWGAEGEDQPAAGGLPDHQCGEAGAGAAHPHALPRPQNLPPEPCVPPPPPAPPQPPGPQHDVGEVWLDYSNTLGLFQYTWTIPIKLGLFQ